MRQLDCHTPSDNSSSEWHQVNFRWDSPSETYNVNSIYEQTGCLASCERNEYIIVDSSFKNREHSVSSQVDHILDYELYLEFNILTGSHKEEEQYVIYDSNSFIADVGGFLGLLLGFSALSLYDEFESLLRALKLKSLLK